MGVPSGGTSVAPRRGRVSRERGVSAEFIDNQQVTDSD